MIDGFAKVREALESVKARNWDSHYGKGVTKGYAQAVDAEISGAFSSLDALEAEHARLMGLVAEFPKEDDYCAWVRYRRAGTNPTWLQICDSDADGAFRVWRIPAALHARLTAPTVAKSATVPAEAKPEDATVTCWKCAQETRADSDHCTRCGAGISEDPFDQMPEAKPESLADGAALIAAERSRQVTAEGYDSSHDDVHASGEILRAAHAYLAVAINPEKAEDIGGIIWPWDRLSFKPSGPIPDLVKSGALIAAEIDRLRRAHITAEAKVEAPAFVISDAEHSRYAASVIAENEEPSAAGCMADWGPGEEEAWIRLSPIEQTQRGKANLAAAIREFSAIPETHAYTSTACHHGLHDRCRKSCKFCDVTCGCACHSANPTPEESSEVAPDTATGTGDDASPLMASLAGLTPERAREVIAEQFAVLTRPLPEDEGNGGTQPLSSGGVGLSPNSVAGVSTHASAATECRWCAESAPEWSYAAKVWIHRRERLDRRCDNPPNDYGYTTQVPEETVSSQLHATECACPARITALGSGPSPTGEAK